MVTPPRLVIAGVTFVPHHLTREAAQDHAQALAEKHGQSWLVWEGRALAGATACWTVTRGDQRFPSCCGLTIVGAAHPRPGGQRP